MKKLIHRIRRQPEAVRRNILHISTLALGVVLVLLWVYSLGSTIVNPETQAKISQDLKPFSALKDNMVGGFNSLSEPSSSVQQ